MIGGKNVECVVIERQLEMKGGAGTGKVKTWYDAGSQVSSYDSSVKFEATQEMKLPQGVVKVTHARAIVDFKRSP